MEFKDISKLLMPSLIIVDIGTEWNLKFDLFVERVVLDTVDIGTEWNLKFFAARAATMRGIS